ncbi:hypothetical protein ABZ636_06995 [Streptomyces sp. NPDC007251]
MFVQERPHSAASSAHRYERDERSVLPVGGGVALPTPAPLREPA